jgi:putative membrane protein
MRFVTWLLTYAAGLSVAAWLLDGIWFDGPTSGQAELQEKILPVLGVALILGLVSTFVEPVVKLLSLPFIILTLGFLLLVINALMLMLTAWLAGLFDLGFHVDGFWNALVGSIIVTIVGWGVRTALPIPD